MRRFVPLFLAVSLVIPVVQARCEDAPAEKPAEQPAEKPAEKPADKPAQAPAKKPAAKDDPGAEKKPFKNMREMLQGMPDEALPRADGWDKYTKPKAEEWLHQTLVGQTYKGSLELHSVTVTPNRDSKSDADAWKITMSMEDPPRFMFRTVEIRPGIATGLILYGDQQFAKNAEKYPKGKVFIVEGSIRTVRPLGWSGNKSVNFTIELEHSKCSLPGSAK